MIELFDLTGDDDYSLFSNGLEPNVNEERNPRKKKKNRTSRARIHQPIRKKKRKKKLILGDNISRKVLPPPNTSDLIIISSDEDEDEDEKEKEKERRRAAFIPRKKSRPKGPKERGLRSEMESSSDGRSSGEEEGTFVFKVRRKKKKRKITKTKMSTPVPVPKKRKNPSSVVRGKRRKTGEKRKRSNEDDEDTTEPAGKKQKVDDENTNSKLKPPMIDENEDKESDGETFECPICYDDRKRDFVQPLTKCKHEFCRPCLKTFYETKITSKNFPILCPMCNGEVLTVDLELILDRPFLEKFERFSLQHHIENNPDHYSCCMTPGCEYYFFYEEGENDFQCPKCEKRYCLKCKVEWHEDSTCAQYQEWKKENGDGDDLFDEFVRGQNFKQCPKCSAWIQKSTGCDHMTCKCKCEFCYKCGSVEWRNCPCRRVDGLGQVHQFHLPNLFRRGRIRGRNRGPVIQNVAIPNFDFGFPPQALPTPPPVFNATFFNYHRNFQNPNFNNDVLPVHRIRARERREQERQMQQLLNQTQQLVQQREQRRQQQQQQRQQQQQIQQRNRQRNQLRQQEVRQQQLQRMMEQREQQRQQREQLIQLQLRERQQMLRTRMREEERARRRRRNQQMLQTRIREQEIELERRRQMAILYQIQRRDEPEPVRRRERATVIDLSGPRNNFMRMHPNTNNAPARNSNMFIDIDDED